MVSSLADVEAATLSSANAASIDLAETVASTVITLLVLSDTFSKMVLAIALGGRESLLTLVLPLVVPLFVGAIVMLAITVQPA